MLLPMIPEIFVVAKVKPAVPLKSPMPQKVVVPVKGDLGVGCKRPSPLPNRRATLGTVWLATARSGFQSPLKSPQRSIAVPSGTQYRPRREGSVSTPLNIFTEFKEENTTARFQLSVPVPGLRSDVTAAGAPPWLGEDEAATTVSSPLPKDVHGVTRMPLALAMQDPRAHSVKIADRQNRIRKALGGNVAPAVKVPSPFPAKCTPWCFRGNRQIQCAVTVKIRNRG